jgi:hypothetical protein
MSLVILDSESGKAFAWQRYGPISKGDHFITTDGKIEQASSKGYAYMEIYKPIDPNPYILREG